MSFPHFASHFVNSPRTLSFVRQHEPPNPRCEGAEEQTAQTNGIGEGLEVDAHPPTHIQRPQIPTHILFGSLAYCDFLLH